MVNLEKMKNYKLVEIIDIKKKDKQMIIVLENGKEEKMKKGKFDFLEIEKGNYLLLNPYNNITSYFGKEPDFKKILYNIEQYELLGERWRDGSGHSRIRKKKRKEIKGMLENFEREYKEKFNKEEIKC